MSSIADDAPFDPYPVLAEHAAHLNTMRRRGLVALPFYDAFAGGLVWTDEFRRWFRSVPTEVICALRAIWAYRTSLMLNEPRRELEEYWAFGLAKFPRWVGFRPERRTATPFLLRLYRRGNVETRKCIRDLEREMDKDEASGRRSQT